MQPLLPKCEMGTELEAWALESSCSYRETGVSQGPVASLLPLRDVAGLAFVFLAILAVILLQCLLRLIWL